MFLLFNIMLCSTFYGLSSEKCEIGIITHIDELYAKRLIDPDHASLYKIYALVKPDKLPDELKSLNRETKICGTSVITDVLRNEHLLSPRVLNEIKSLLLPDPDDDDVLLDSDKYPIRIHFPSNFNEQHKFGYDQCLGYAEKAWEKEVDKWGFTPPPPDNGFGGNDNYDIFIRDFTYAGGYMLELSRDFGVDWYCMASCCVVSFRFDYLQETLSHEFNHSCQCATDPLEENLAAEGSASYIGIMVAYGFFAGSKSSYFMGDFQKLPYKSIDFHDSELSYEYGTSLFIDFLCEFYDSGNPEFLREIWDGCKQKGTINEPDFLDSITNLVYDYKGHTFNDTYREFALWRYFTNKNDDGKHFEDGAEWGNEVLVNIEKTVTLWNIPMVNFHPANPPAEYGANYIEFFLKDMDGGLTLDFKGHPTKSWSSDLLLFTSDLSYQKAEVVKLGNSNGFLFLPDIGTYEKMVLIISNLSDGDHDPDNYDWQSSDYTLNAKIASEPEATVITNKQFYNVGDKLGADVVVVNPTGAPLDIDLVAAVKAGDYVLYYPNFTPDINKKRIFIEANSSMTETILTINQTGEWIKDGLTFFAAILDPKTGGMIGMVNETDIGYCDPEKPTAKFTVSPETGNLDTMFIVNAEGSFDNKDNIGMLQFRWDWEDDGEWDTLYSSKVLNSHKYSTTGSKTIRLELKDTDGNTSSTTKTVVVN
jgi:hypothetical protein